MTSSRPLNILSAAAILSICIIVYLIRAVFYQMNVVMFTRGGLNVDTRMNERYNKTLYTRASLGLDSSDADVRNLEHKLDRYYSEILNYKKKTKQKYTMPFPDPIGCRIHLAESSIPNSGLGIYSAIDVPIDSVVTENDIPIQYTDLYIHNENGFGPDKWLLENYYWAGSVTHAAHEAYDVQTALPSFGMAANCHMGLFNVDLGLNDHDATRMHRSKDPGAGAVTDYPTISWYATKKISKGTEIFFSYGTTYFSSPESEKRYGMIPFADNYEEADAVAKRFHSILSKDAISTDSKQRLWDLFRDLANPRTKSALPPNSTVLKQVVEKGTALFSAPNSTRSTQWLEEHGQCMDNLSIKPSAIPMAGRGAFTTCFIPRGSLVAPAPLVQMHRENLNMYELVQESPNSKPKKKNNIIIGQQLLLNYCFGHRNSSLLLFPYSTAVQLINHKSDGHNAEVRWSTSIYHHADWLDKSVEELTVEYTGLMFDIIAIKDILPGEEVFIDYGREWEEAWNKHVEEWRPVQGAENFVHQDVLNKDMKSLVRTKKEQETEPYPRNLQTSCFYKHDESKPGIKVIHEIEETEEKVMFKAQWYYNEDRFHHAYLQPCNILTRYEVGSLTRYDAHMPELSESGEYIVYAIPREAIKFTGKMYSSDMFLKNVFHHAIGIPDDMFPSTWINFGE